MSGTRHAVYVSLCVFLGSTTEGRRTVRFDEIMNTAAAELQRVTFLFPSAFCLSPQAFPVAGSAGPVCTGQGFDGIRAVY